MDRRASAMEVVVRTGRHHGPEGIGDILHKVYAAQWLCRRYEEVFGKNIALLCDWRNTSYCAENIFPILFDNRTLMGVDLITDSWEIDSIMSKLPNYYGGVTPHEMIVPHGTYPFHGIEIRFTEDTSGEVLELWKELVPLYNILATGRFEISRDFRGRKSFYQDLHFSDKVKRIVHERFSNRIDPAGKVLGIHYRHGNGELDFGELTIENIQKLVENEINSNTFGVGKITAILVCTDSEELRNSLESTGRERGVEVVLMRREFPESGTGPLHGRGLASSMSVVEDCAEMVALARCDGLLYNYSFFNHYANFVGSYDFRKYVPTRGNREQM